MNEYVSDTSSSEPLARNKYVDVSRIAHIYKLT